MLLPLLALVPRHLLFALLLLGCGASGAAERESSEAARAAIGASTSAVLQGDSVRATAALRGVPAAQFGPEDAGYRACMIGRFDHATPPQPASEVDDPFVRALLRTYRTYWWHALTAPAKRDAFAEDLLQRLREMLDVTPAQAKDLDAIDPLLGKALDARGFHSIRGRTPPLWELMAWRDQQTRHHDVALPEGGTQPVDVVLMDGFVSRGWSHYGRCERGGAAGWTTEDAIYAVAPAYDLDSDEYRASLLAHESQHFADQTRFPGLKSWELEYRAKLAELWAAHATQAELLDKFAQSQSDDLDSPHTYANKRVLADLRTQLHVGRDASAVELGKLPRDALCDAARAVLVADSARRTPAKPAMSPPAEASAESTR